MIDVATLRQRFVDWHGTTPRIFRAPGRINLIGEHTDYNDGFVLPAAIDKATFVAISPRTDRTIIADSIDFEGTVSVVLDDRGAYPRTDWGKYVQGIALVLESSGYKLGGADLLIASEIPVGAGLSSSAALEVAVASALTAIAGHTIDGVELAKIGQAAEHKYAGVRSGIMDQFVSVHGKAGRALLLDCRSLEWSNVALQDGALVICNTKTKHDLADGEYNKRRSECENAAAVLAKNSLRDVRIADLEDMPTEMPEKLRKRARHVVTENARVLDAVAALKSENLQEFGELINRSHNSLRDDFEVSCPELDAMVEIAREQPGVLGSRMMGGGFGGCTINLMLTEAREAFISRVQLAYKERTSVEPELYEVTIERGACEII